jgi:Leucine-rich repeat (LRR) protein
LEFYEATGGHAWNENYGWAQNLPDLCDWHGVLCADGKGDRMLQEQDGVVAGLKLSSNFLTGRTPSSLWRLPSLTLVDVSYNPNLDVDFAGLNGDTTKLEHLEMRQTGTTSVSGVSQARETLEIVNLSENKLNTQFPPDLYELTKLTTLHLAECHLRGSLPDNIHRLSMLRELNLYKNDLTGTLPEGLSRLVHMRHLTLSFNQFHGTLPAFISDDMFLLEQFWATNNDFTGTIPSFASAPGIFKLYLNGNSFSGEFPQNFLEATIGGPNNNILSINLSHNEFTGVIPESIDRLSDLEINWRLGDNKWEGVPEVLCDNENWNEGNIAEFGCFGLLCPPGEYSRLGFATEEEPCRTCDTAEYYGATNCFDKDERSVLTELYAATGGEKWLRNKGWLDSSISVCEWEGIVCWNAGDSRDGRIRWIELPNNNLQGEIPESIFSVEHMTTLDVSRNPVTVPFNNIAKAQHLHSINVAGTNTKDFDGIENANSFFRRLYADQTPISGTIPKELLRVSNLEVLSLQECDLNGEMPADLFDAMTSLQELYLSNNNLRGNIPDRWDILENLEVLSLAMNQFRGPLPSTFGTAPSLTSVSVQDQLTKGGGLTGSLPSFAQTQTLSQLHFGSNKIEGELPDDFLATVEEDALLTIDLTNNKLTGTVHGSYDRFRKMNIYLQGNRISEIDSDLCNNAAWMSGGVGSFGCDAILCPAGTMGGRRQFSDIGCQVCPRGSSGGALYLGQVGCGEDAVAKGERGILELLFNRMGGPNWSRSDNWMTDTSVCSWYGIDCEEDGSVASIQLGSNQLTGSFPTEIYQLPSLIRLKLHGNFFAMDFTGIENARHLRTLDLENTGLPTLNGIGQARSLVELKVGHNNIQGGLPEELSRLVNLETLDVSHNNLNSVVPSWLGGLVSLKTLSASNTGLSGPMPDFASLSGLVYIDLSSNRLSGPLPPSLLAAAPSDEKVVVDLSHNRIGGNVPAELGRLTLLSIQLQDNMITTVDGSLCEIVGLNDFSVMSYGCDGILCPVGTFSSLGRQSNDDMPCEPCSKAKYMGATHCGKSSADARTKLSFGLALGAALSWYMML